MAEKKPAPKPTPDWHTFEDDVFRAVKLAARHGIIPVISGQTKFLRKAKYPTASGEIEIEIAVEAYAKGAIEPCMIYLVECKRKGKRKVEIGDVQILHTKVQQIGLGRTSAMMVTTNGYQKGALDFAANCGIKLCILTRKLESVMKFSEGAKPEVYSVIMAKDAIDKSKGRFGDMLNADMLAHFPLGTD